MTNVSKNKTRQPHSYRNSGVDIDAGNRLVEALKPLAAATRRPGYNGNLGGFGGIFDPAEAGYSDPLLVAATDGVGTKLKIASATGLHGNIGVDLVAMCVNDLVVQGAEPLFFLDYFATSKLDPDVAHAVVSSIAKACLQAGCALIGGETAEMPDHYAPGDYDLAGFALGAVERADLLPQTDIGAGEKVFGITSDGLHANGFSLVRALVAEAGADYLAPAPFAPDKTLGELLLTPTRIYVKPLLRALRGPGRIKALAHITGGGLTENLPRVLPAGVAAEIDLGALQPDPIFSWLAAAGDLEQSELLTTFNCGIGMVMIGDDTAAEQLVQAGERVTQIGETVARLPGSPQFIPGGRLALMTD